jgi:hypothetical protein
MRIAHVLSIASLGPTTLALSLGLGAGLLATSGSGCKVQSIFTCVDDTNCQSHGEGGVCEANSFCTFPDAECTTGKRWHDRAGDLAGECFEVDGGSGSGSDGSGGSGSSDDAPAEESGSDSTPVTTAGSSSGEPPDPSTGPAAEDSSSGGGSGSTGAPGMCDAQYGAATDYMFCEETVDSCTFVTTTAMAMTCTAVCTSFGGTCVTGHSNDVEPCTPVAEVGCEDMASNDMICVCSNGA